MEKTSEHFFSYPPNLHELDLATLVSMYRDRGIPKKAKPGEYFACTVTDELIKEGKWWFGRYYSQKAWDETLTKGCEGYPLTEVEMNVLGLVYAADDQAPRRDYVEQNCGAVSKLAYMIVNDLKEFGFLSFDDQERLLITPRGEKALQGVTKRIYGKKFKPDMLKVNQGEISHPKIERAPKEDSEQANLF
ncbi:MAG TPA: hypothetical protein VJ964_11475 [Balneolaceae bacterium]|nr:hypothetical protein [Balneolaceae bacterium]